MCSLLLLSPWTTIYCCCHLGLLYIVVQYEQKIKSMYVCVCIYIYYSAHRFDMRCPTTLTMLSGLTCVSLPCRPKLLLLYKAYFASYASGLLMLVFWDTRRNDFWAMLLHHAATVILVALSYHLGCVPPLQLRVEHQLDLPPPRLVRGSFTGFYRLWPLSRLQ